MNDGSISKASWLASLSRDLCLPPKRAAKVFFFKVLFGTFSFWHRKKWRNYTNSYFGKRILSQHTGFFSHKYYPIQYIYYTPKAMFILQNHRKHNDSLFELSLSSFYPPTTERAVFEGVWKGMIDHFAQCSATQQNGHCLE
jgi:hypothetical protein